MRQRPLRRTSSVPITLILLESLARSQLEILLRHNNIKDSSLIGIFSVALTSDIWFGNAKED